MGYSYYRFNGFIVSLDVICHLGNSLLGHKLLFYLSFIGRADRPESLHRFWDNDIVCINIASQPSYCRRSGPHS